MQITLNRRVQIIISILFVLYVIYSIKSAISNRPLTSTSASIYRDWNDYKLLIDEAKRTGPGEHGAAVYLDDQQDIQLNEEFIEKTGFSAVVSFKISVNRSLPRTVHPDCINIKYLANLPPVSVIIIFHNEVPSVLLRTIHSIVNRTPPELLKEIILVNDFSTDDYDNLPDYFPPNLIKIKSLSKRSGLIVARMEGARAATAEILVFFDSHVEVQNYWLPPLIEPIVKNRKIATLPIIDYFDCRTFEYYPDQDNNLGTRGVIDWYLNFHELEKLPADQKNPLNPYPNPIMLGCAFAIDRTFFIDELGGYDEELKIWNGENYELSFKLWMCRDGLFTVPCSRVGHSFRDINPSRKFEDDYVARNFKRIAEVWLDEFKEVLYDKEPSRYRNLDPGDLTRAKLIRDKLNCKSFRWFLKNVAPDMAEKYPPISLPVFASGTIQSVANPRLCLDNLERLFHDRIGTFECSDDMMEPSDSQKFKYTFFKDLRQVHKQNDYCLDAFNLNMFDCNELDGGNQFWIYDRVSKEIKIDASSSSDVSPKCIEIDLQDSTIKLEKCNGDDSQKWNFGYVNETAFEKFEDTFGYHGVFSVSDL